MNDILNDKYRRLREGIRALESVVVAYSGGIDSTLVLKVAVDELGERALGVTAVSPSVPARELAEAGRLAAAMGARHRVIETHELSNPDYAANPANRCYFCKTELYKRLSRTAREEGARAIANGTNRDDLGDYRPGLQAADEFAVVSPLCAADFGKADVRELAQALGVEIWDKPASPCLSSRIPYGSVVTLEKLGAIEAAESLVRALGPRELRVRHFGARARIEAPAEDLVLIEARLPELRPALAELGFQEIELREFKSGALNAALDRH